ncbi:MAG TPA: sigma factor-like helix-turn-helix DNA-binding protein [Streptosporangiaceae bacterium]
MGERHVEAARRLAVQLTCNEDAAENLLAEAFEIARAELARGDGPDLAFRPYLLTLVRDVAAEWASDGKRLLLADSYDALAASRDAVGDDSLAARAFARMPERWRVALWHTAVEGESTTDIAPLLGLSPSAVLTLVQRARDGLRRVYLQADLDDDLPRECHEMRDLMADDARGRLSRRQRNTLDEHVDSCDRCRAVSRDVAEIDGSLGELVGGAVLGPFAAAYALPPDPGAAEENGAPARRRGLPMAAVFAGVGIVVVAASAFGVITMTNSSSDTGTNAQSTPAASNPGPSDQPSSGPSDWTAWPSHQPRHHSHTPDPSTTSAQPSDSHSSQTSHRSHAPDGGGQMSREPHHSTQPQPSSGPSKTRKPDPTPTKSHSPSPSPTPSCPWYNPNCWFK